MCRNSDSVSIAKLWGGRILDSCAGTENNGGF